MQKIRKHRNVIYLLLLLLFGLLIIAVQQRGRLPDSALTRFFLRIAAPPLNVLHSVNQSIGNTWQRLFHQDEIQQENLRLRAEAAKLKTQRDLLLENVRRLNDMGRLVDAAAYDRYDFIPASVIARSFSANVHTIKINKGLADGVQPGQPVVDLNGLAGIVEECVAHAAIVRLTIGRNFAVAALIEESRLQGYAQGEGNPVELAFHFDNLYIRPESGQRVITSGIAGASESILPKGLLIGHVANTEAGAESRPYARVVSAVDFSKLEEVVVLIARNRYDDAGDLSVQSVTTDTLQTSSALNLD